MGPVLIVTGLVEEEQVRTRRRPSANLVHICAPSVPTFLSSRDRRRLAL
jgi:hypothetical protein